jgi:hypothetical protein
VDKATSTAAMTAEGVTYFRYPGFDSPMFRCPAYRCSLATGACAARWREAKNTASDEAYRFERCRGCSVGSQHAGEKNVTFSPLFGMMICNRCGTGTNRLIRGELCPSCYNRELEVKSGANGKGTKPVKAKLDPRRIGVIVDFGASEQRLTELRREYSADTEELVVSVLRTTPGRVAFTRAISSRLLAAGADS